MRQCSQLEAFINESLRIQPVVPLISRYPTKDIKLDDNYTVLAGTDIVIFIEGLTIFLLFLIYLFLIDFSLLKQC